MNRGSSCCLHKDCQPYHSSWHCVTSCAQREHTAYRLKLQDDNNLADMTTQTVQENTNSSSPAPSSLYHQLESYPFTTDPEFQSGLTTILSSSPSQDPDLLTLRARCFFFSRKQNVPIDFSSYISWRSAQNLPPVTTSNPGPEFPSSKPETNGISGQRSEQNVDVQRETEQQPSAPYPSSFSQIVELITKGEPIPGIKEVPDTLLTGQESAATIAKRKKPWEKDEAVEDMKETIQEAVGEGLSRYRAYSFSQKDR